MKCPKCHYVSHDYLDACRKCGIDLVTFKQDIGLIVLQPGALDLSLVLGGSGADDLFECIEEEVIMHVSDDDDFDISLDDYAEHSEVRRAPTEIRRPGRPEPEIDLAGMGHLTLELDAAALPAAVTASLWATQRLSDTPVTSAPPPPAQPGAPPLPGLDTLEMDAESISMDGPPGLLEEVVPVGPLPSQDAPKSLELGLDKTLHVTDFSGAVASLQPQDVVLANATPAAVDDAVLTPEVREPSASDMADVVDPALTTLDEPRLQDMELLPAFEFELSTLAEAEATLSHRSGPALGKEPLTSADEALSFTPSVDEWAPLTLESIPEDMLTSLDMSVFENVEETMPPGHLTLELDASVLPYDAPQLPTTLTSASIEPILPPADAAIFEDPGDIVLPGHLTLELDRSDMAFEISSIILDSLQLEPPPGGMQSQMSPGEAHANDEAELLLDLDNLACDDDTPV
jgi:hypothetical protein